VEPSIQNGGDSGNAGSSTHSPVALAIAAGSLIRHALLDRMAAFAATALLTAIAERGCHPVPRQEHVRPPRLWASDRLTCRSVEIGPGSAHRHDAADCAVWLLLAAAVLALSVRLAKSICRLAGDRYAILGMVVCLLLAARW